MSTIVAFKKALARAARKLMPKSKTAQAVEWVKADPDPVAGRTNRWYDPITEFSTSNRHQAIAWVRLNGRGLRHYWVSA